MPVVSVILIGCTKEVDGPSVSAAAWFRDVAAEAGLEFRHENGALGEFQVPEIMGSGCAWIDHDRDGHLDAYLVSAGNDPVEARNRLFRNRGNGTFEDVTEGCGADDAGFGMGCAVGDYDGDGAPDIYVTNFGRNALYRNNRDGTFTDITDRAGVGDPRWSTSAIFTDVDADGHLDLFVTNYMRHPPKATRRCTDGAGMIEYCGPNSHFPPDRDTLYRNNGDGTFRDITAEAGMATRFGYGLGVIGADFDGDGHGDIFVANDATANQLWIGDGSGRFRDVAVEWGAAFNEHGQAEASMGVQAEDLDGDGLLDIFITHLVNETNTLYRGMGGGRFEDRTAGTGLGPPSLSRTGFGLGFLDADHDGDLDLLVTNGRIRRGPIAPGRGEGPLADPYAETDQFFEHVAADPTGRGRDPGGGPRGLRFEDRSREAGAPFLRPHIGRGLALGDYDNDGDVDALVTACRGRARLLRNDTPRKGNWLLVHVVRAGDRGDCHDARVTVEAGGERWTRRVQPAYSYLSSSDPRVHFGLGPVEVAHVTVEWPDGTTRSLRDVGVNRMITVGKGAARQGATRKETVRDEIGREDVEGGGAP